GQIDLILVHTSRIPANRATNKTHSSILVRASVVRQHISRSITNNVNGIFKRYCILNGVINDLKEPTIRVSAAYSGEFKICNIRTRTEIDSSISNNPQTFFKDEGLNKSALGSSN